MIDRRAFITGLLTAPMIVRASSLDALPRGMPLAGVNNHIRIVRDVQSTRLYALPWEKISGGHYELTISPNTGWVSLTKADRPTGSA